MTLSGSVDSLTLEVKEPSKQVPSIRIRRIGRTDRTRVEAILMRRWGSSRIVTRGRVHSAADYPGYVAIADDRIVGLITFRIDRDRCEVISLDALRKKRGIGTRLLAAVERTARRAGCREAWLITTNDNLEALRFYQRRGWRLRRVYPDALDVSRRLKPTIPLHGDHGIPLRDEIELVRRFDRRRAAKR